MKQQANDTPHRFEVHRWSDPQLPFILHTDMTPPPEEQNLANWHDSPEFLYVTEGRGTLFCGGARYEMAAGRLLVIGSGEMHRMQSEEDLQYHCLIVGSAFCKENGFDPARLRYQRCVEDTDLTQAFLDAVDALRCDSDTPFRVTAIRCAVLSFLLLLNRRASLPQADMTAVPAPDPVRDGLQYINSHYQQALTVDAIAAHARMSKYHFLRRFKETTGYTVGTYIRLLRCRRATELLRTTSDRIADVARACGFESPSYFAKTFTAIIGMRPADYRSAATPPKANE